MPGPVVSKNLVMTIRGVEMISDVPAWETATTKHIMGNLPPGYSDVEISLELKKQVSSNEALNKLFKRRLLSEWLPWLDHWHTQSPGQYYLRGGANNSQQQRQRRLQGKVEVGYEQTSTWQTDNPNNDEINLILNAFSTRQTTTRYVNVLKSLGYSSVTSVGSITIDPIPEGAPISDAILGIVRTPQKSWFKKVFGGDMEEKTETSIVVAVSAMLVLFAGFAAVAIRRRRKNRRMKEIQDDSLDGSSSSSDVGGRRKSKKSSGRAKDKDKGRTGDNKKGITKMKVSSIKLKKSEKKDTKKDRSLSPGDLEDGNSSSDEEGRGRSKGSSSDDNKKKRRSRSTRKKRDSSEESSKDDKKGRRSRSTRKKRDSSEESSSDEDEKRWRRSRGTRNRSVSSEESSSDEDGRRGRRSRSALKQSKSARRAKSKRRGRSISFSSDDSDSQISSIDEGGRYKSRRRSQGRRSRSRNTARQRASSLHAFRDTHQSRNKYHSQASTMEETPFGSSEGNIYRSRSSGVDVDLMMDNPLESPPSLVMATSPKSKTSTILFHIFAPPGKLGVIMDTPPEGGNAYVCHIKESCPIIDNIRLNDKVLMVDDEDVQTMNAADVSRLLARKSRQAHRKISVLREVVKREPLSSMCDSDAFVDELDHMGLPIENGILIPSDHGMMVSVEDSRPHDYGMMVPVDESRLAEF